jgi:hypothetical protein
VEVEMEEDNSPPKLEVSTCAREELARELHFQFERIDPTGETWDTLDEPTRDMYRHALGALLDLHSVLAAL